MKKEKRGRARQANPANHVPKQKKSMLLDELGNALVDEIHNTSSLDRPLNVPNGSIIDYLRSHSLVTSTGSTTETSSSASNSCSLTRTDSTALTSPDDHSVSDMTITPLIATKILVGSIIRSKESLRTGPNARQPGDVCSLGDFSTTAAILRLTGQYGRVAHMGILDHSYRFFVNQEQTAALSFRVHNRVAIVGGDPLCERSATSDLLDGFAKYRKQHGWDIAFMGVSESFIQEHAQPRGWMTIRFGTERVLNPLTNDVLHENSSKRIAVQNRQLLHPQKGKITMGAYAPAVHGVQSHLEEELVAIYDSWRATRNEAAGPQAFITVYNPFALPTIMTFVYSRGPDGAINGFAAIRRLGSGGYHIDPYIAAPGSPKGISDLLIVGAMALLHQAGVSYLGFGFEPVSTLSLEDITGIRGPFAGITRNLYEHACQRLPIHGKKAYHDKFRPDSPQDSGLFLAFPTSIPKPRYMLAMMHMANVSLRKVVWADLRSRVATRKSKSKIVPDLSKDPEKKVPVDVEK
ncbi:hypothetical protein N7495_004625 [Penicillium taxi]|uniref:uncharacterized protein n=1 Tax=Penicillium taxi TaxID=168475 RepID=UPI002545680E|nr:uncharacterized protein N7495_004625 [Penicillium taxi]KAJ5899881.1 hypothetical protein N7495_004625 [Penicillium taxi]